MHYPVKVCASLIPGAGLGVFATHDVKKGSILCYFDGYEKPIDQLELWEMFYSLKSHNDEKLCFVGHKIPQNPGGVGQLINDVAVYDKEYLSLYYKESSYGFVPVMPYLVILSLYYQDSSHCNVISKNKKIFAIRDIKQGEELYLSYGIGHWSSTIDETFTKGTDNITEAINTYYVISKWYHDNSSKLSPKNADTINDTDIEGNKMKMIIAYQILERLKHMSARGADMSSLFTPNVSETIKNEMFNDGKG